MAQTDIILVKTNNQKKVFQVLSKDFSGKEPPLWLILLAAYLRDKGFSVAVLDAEAENLDTQETVEKILRTDPRLVSIIVSGTNPSASTINMPGARLVLNELDQQAPDLPTALAGLHPSALPAQTLNEETVDYVIQGEGFSTHAQLIEALQKGPAREEDLVIKGLWYKRDGQIVSNPRADNIQDLSQLPMPAWDFLPMDKYRAHNWHCFDHIHERNPYAVLYTSLGCPFRCSFCCINAIFGKPGIRYRPTKAVMNEIDYLVKHYKIKNIKVIDEMFVLSWPHVEAICDQVIARGYDLNFWAYARVDTIKPHMLSKMKKAGFNWIAYGFESGSKRVRDGVTKGRFGTDQIKEVVQMTHEAGIHIVANFIFGLPDDDMETMRETLDLAKELNCAYANLYCAMAYPGSQLYQEAIAQKIPLPKNWSAYSQFSIDCLPLPTKYLSSAQVLRFRDMAFNEYHTNPAYIKMIEDKFGPQAVENITEMCSVQLKRHNYDQEDKVRFHCHIDECPS